ncbi:hypothetical protein EVAR_92171_1 [Eumeta japonica]|uniref:Uncharacterized protein n=1 Tax=Eumeta variegata TaxID=151549 RepID=A0A4C1T194_EUMVA|nr:hypothetical protein EVAR_92171_1 [Eumeta japonica]
MYEDRGENLSYLHKYDLTYSMTPIDSWGHSVKDPEETRSVSESKSKLKRDIKPRSKELARKKRSRPVKIRKLLRAFNADIATKPAFTSEKQVFDNRGKSLNIQKITNDSPKPSPNPQRPT